MKSVLVVSNKSDILRVVAKALHGLSVKRAPDRASALEMLRGKRFDPVFIDADILGCPDSEGAFVEALHPFRQLYPTLEIVVMTDREKIRSAVAAVKAGARDYLTFPLDSEEVKLVFENLDNYRMVLSELNYLRGESQTGGLGLLRTNNENMKRVLHQVLTVAPTKSTVLLLGETGTGKSSVARVIHQHSNRKDAQFISVHCGALPDTLIESEMFGHEKGAFTGAVRRKLGKFEFASGGTIFLDEIGTISAATQVKLLQVIQDGTYQRVGGDETLKADVRIIAASNSDLKKMAEAGTFRKDLYYRLNVFPIEIPPLRDRIEDLRQLLDAFIQKWNQYSSKKITGIHPQTLNALKGYDWPGNIRELENIVERACILENAPQLTLESFPIEFSGFSNASYEAVPSGGMTLDAYRRQGVEVIERKYLEEALTRNRGKIGKTARDAGIGPRQLNKLMNRYGLRKESFKP